MTDRAAAARPGCAGFGWCQRGVDVMPGCHRQARGSRPAISERLVCPGARVPLARRALPLSKRPGLTVCGFIDRRFRPGITAGYICGKRSAYLCAIAAWRVDSFAFFSVHRARIALSQVKALLRARPGNTIPSISPMCAQARRRFTQVIHMVVHSKACTTFSCRAGRQRVSVPVLARGGRHPGRGSGLGLDDIAPDGGHRMLAARPAGQAARVPSRLPAVTLTVIPPAAPPRYAQAARAQPPPALALRLRHHGHEPEREAPIPIDDRVQQLITGRQRPMPGHWPPEASLLATARHPVLRARTLAVLHGSVAGAALAITASGPARRPENLAPARPDPRPSRPTFPWLPGAGPGKTVLPGRIRHGPSMYEMEGPCPASPRRLASCLVFAARRAPPAGARYPREGPVSRLLPRSRRRPRVVPVSSGESIITTATSTAQDPAASHFLFFRYPRRNPQRAGSYPHFTAVIHGFTHSLPTGYRV